MRVESPLVSQSLIEAPKTIEKKELVNSIPLRDAEDAEEINSYFPSPFGASGTYSISSLRAAVDYHAKFLTVAENNLQAASHPAVIPQAILARFNTR